MAKRSSKTGKQAPAGKKKSATKKAAKKKATSKASSKKAATKKSTTSKPASKPRAGRSTGASANSPQVNVTMSHDEIASRAYSIWLAKGCPPDSARRDWREAEAQLRADQAGPAPR